MSDQDPEITRRKFIKTTAAAGAEFMIVPRHVLGRGFQAPSDLVNIATVGATGMGAVNTRAVMSQNIVALCDVDFGLLDARLDAWSRPPKPPGPPRPQGPPPPPTPWRNHGPSKAQIAADARWPAPDEEATLRRFVEQQMPRLQKYRDYREMLEKQKDLDAIIVATPDHMHAPIASAAMSLGKHVYVQKPLCWSVHEARHLAKKAQDNPKIVTQMGNQRHSADNSRRGIEYVQSGVLGEIREVHVWTNRPLGFWPQGIPRPARSTTDLAQLRWDNRGVMQRLSAAMAGTNGAYPVPEKLSWDLFLGVAPVVEYHPLYHPFNWRGWVDWGQGALGDMGAHLMDFPVWSLNLGLPTVIETEATPFNGVSFPNATTTYFQFPARKGMPPVKLTWYDGGLLPPDPEELENETLDPNGGVLYVGKKAKLLHYSEGARLLPTSKHNAFGAPKERLPRVPHGDHEMNWVNAIKGTDQISVPFDYAAKLTEIMLLGIVSLRANSKLHYDGANMRVTNNVAANDFLTREYRAGFSL